MREILFRGKRIDNGKWVYGDLVHAENKFYISYYYESALKTFINETIEYNGVLIIGIAPFIEVDPSTIGQYTGLTDKNGKKIFDGDVLEHTNVNGKTYKECVVAEQWSFKWSHGVYGFSLTDLNGGYMMDLRYTKSYEVIGNIHDNPELLNNSELLDDKP